MANLTDVQLRQWVKAAKPIAGRSDGGGLTFTLSKSGAAAWVLRYRFAGRHRELSLGRYPDVSLKEARRRASEERARVAAGMDVAAEKRREKIAHAHAQSFSDLAEDYMVRSAPQLAETTRRETRRFLDKDILPRIGRLALKDVTPGEVVYLIERIAERSQSVAKRTFEIISVIFAHGMAKHLVPMNPCTSLKVSPIIGSRVKRRQRIKLSIDELRAMLAALPGLGVENTLAVKILLATCVRKSELIHSRWEHLDLEQGLWTIPDENSKSRKGFVVPLAPTVAHWFEALQNLSGGSDYVLPSRRRGYGSHNRPICANSLNAALKRLDGEFRRFSPHDLRSTARSHLASLGVDVIVAERCLNHSLGGLVAVYDQHDYFDERKRALELWASSLESMEQVQPSNVVPLKKVVGESH